MSYRRARAAAIGGVLAMLLAVVIVAAGGCGDDERERAGSRAEPRRAPPVGALTDESLQVPAKPSPAERVATRRRARLRERRRRARLRGRSRRYARIATTTLELLGLGGTRVDVTPDAKRMIVTLPRARACRATRAGEPRLQEVLLQPFPSLEAVRFRVEGSRRTLPAYARRACGRRRPLAIPTGPGQLVYDTAGSGLFQSPSFRIRRRSWRVEYGSEGGVFQVVVLRNGVPLPQIITHSGRGAGSAVFPGRGRFSLKVAGSRGWTVRAREGR